MGQPDTAPSREAILGPFDGGMNTYSQPGAIQDNEVVESMNLIPDIDGSLKCRPPWAGVYAGGATFGFANVDCIGSGIISGTNYVFFSNNSGIYKHTGTGSPTLIAGTAGVYAQSCVQYKDWMYFVAEPNSAQPGGRWQGGAWTSIPAIPKGQACVIFKERMWVAPGKHAFVNPSRLSFSNIADPTTWGGADFFDITAGDGSNLVDLVIFNNNLLLFKQGSTYYLSYDTKPADATNVKISNKIGASNWRCVVQHQNDTFVMHENNVYQLVNFNWVKINTKVVFVLDTTAPGWTTREVHTFLSVIGDWLVCKFHHNVYIYNCDTQTWTKWSSQDDQLHDFGPIVQLPGDDLFNVNESYYAGNSLAGSTLVSRIKDGWDAATVEVNDVGFNWDILCWVTTKSYSFNLPWRMKRLFSWSAEVITNKAVQGTATPIAINSPAAVVTTIGAAAGPSTRRDYRFPKGLRFREIQFNVQITSNGSTVDGPAQIYQIMAFVKSAQVVPKAVN